MIIATEVIIIDDCPAVLLDDLCVPRSDWEPCGELPSPCFECRECCDLLLLKEKAIQMLESHLLSYARRFQCDWQTWWTRSTCSRAFYDRCRRFRKLLAGWCA